jgi:hypothetical protein
MSLLCFWRKVHYLFDTTFSTSLMRVLLHLWRINHATLLHIWHKIFYVKFTAKFIVRLTHYLLFARGDLNCKMDTCVIDLETWGFL